MLINLNMIWCLGTLGVISVGATVPFFSVKLWFSFRCFFLCENEVGLFYWNGQPGNKPLYFCDASQVVVHMVLFGDN